ncbi:Rpn family recombination-promoting nuclease/putative transposase [Nostoc sp. ATCC 53789]|uniref:Rpn family recombination-promoting nuclease/putative transposase n=1 Tax=Nostoc sp. ATCC 53789 TaxID=76335 RepID=UPI000DED1EF6|nr:Rpn family recombination-promoting nuclease/putative transposase [Nostoc sp. ATCC 53789]QHG20643.1 cytosolic protein [Nostoc sp. ATCC 53789]
MDQELQQVVRDAELGERLADKLVKIYRTDGEESWILVHLEIQSQEESNFAARMFTYNYRIYDRYKRSVASLAVLGDERSNWRPNQFGYNLFGCTVEFTFPIVKLLDYQQRQSELEASRNPLATVVMAHLKAMETRDDRIERKQQKLVLVRRLYEQGLRREDVINLFGFIDWMMTLPAQLEEEFWQEYRDFEESLSMQYVTSVERFGIEKGKLEALLKGIALGLKLKFGKSGQDLFPEIESIQDVSLLEAILEGIDTASTVSQLRQIYQ